MEMLDCRRLTGHNRIWSHPGAILDIAVDETGRDRVVSVWTGQVRRMLDAVDWSAEHIAAHPLTGGVSLAISAPVDALYAATEVCEWAWAASVAQLGGDPAEPLDAAATRLRASIAEESNPPLLALKQAAAEHDVAFTSDDDEASVGQGTGSNAWPTTALPTPDAVDWASLHDIPVGLVTGTNGKTTTVRLAAGIARHAGRCTGVSSTDWISVDDDIVDHGDYSGPGGARTVLRDRRVELAVLETARGGLLRRGLGTERANAALITNISADHVGDFGCRDLDELLEVKWSVSRAVENGGRLVLNAEDARLEARGRHWPGTVVWFALDEANLGFAIGAGNDVWTVRDGAVGAIRSGRWSSVCRIDAIPVTLGGAAIHNVANALAAAALCSCLGIADAALGPGLMSVQPANNPGRSNVMSLDGRTVVLDFAHNPAAVEAVLSLAAKLSGERRLVAFGEAGDRPDGLLRDLADAVWAVAPDRVLISELAHYRRGREAGEVAGVLRDQLMSLGARNDQIGYHEREIDTLHAALDWSQPGDVLVLLILGEQQAVYDHLKSLGAR